MSLFKRDRSPFYYTEIVVNGRRIVRSTGAASARDALLFERKLREELKRETPKRGTQAKPSLTLSQACGKYWDEHGYRLKDARNVKRWLIYIVRFLDPDMPLHELSTRHVTQMVADMNAGRIGKISINRTVTCLQGVHNRAAKKWEEAVNLIDWSGHKVRENQRTRWQTQDQAKVFLDALPVHIREIVLFILSTGLRRREAFTLERDKVHLETATVSVLVKGGRIRTVPLSPDAVAVLRGAQDRGRFVFDTTNWRKHFARALKVAEIEDFRWHDLRHTFSTWLGQSGASLEVIRDLLIHSSISVTQKYRHVSQREVRQALQNLPTLSPSTGNVVNLKTG